MHGAGKSIEAGKPTDDDEAGKPHGWEATWLGSHMAGKPHRLTAKRLREWHGITQSN